jgi:hypothetical protein
VHVDPTKIQFICDWSDPKTLIEICNFLGLAKLYYRFVFGFSHISWALRQVTKGGVKANFVNWVASQHKSFKDLKLFLYSELVLIILDMKQPFYIETNALDYVIIAVLTQHGQPMDYHSETLYDVVWRYPTYEKEMYYIVQAY